MSSARNAAYSAATCACIAWVFLMVAVTSPWLLWGYVAGVGVGVGPFYAGYSATSIPSAYGWTYIASTVWWSQINSENACSLGNVYNDWSKNAGLCDSSGNFVMPSAVIAIQATTCLAVIFSFFACSLGYSVSGSREGGGYGAAVSSLLAMIFSICAFALWTTWNMSLFYQSSSGYPVPLWTTVPNQLGVTQNVRMWYGASYVLIILAFIDLLFATAAFFSVANQLKSAGDQGDFGAGV